MLVAFQDLGRPGQFTKTSKVACDAWQRLCRKKVWHARVVKLLTSVPPGLAPRRPPATSLVQRAGASPVATPDQHAHEPRREIGARALRRILAPIAEGNDDAPADQGEKEDDEKVFPAAERIVVAGLPMTKRQASMNGFEGMAYPFLHWDLIAITTRVGGSAEAFDCRARLVGELDSDRLESG